jgi:hypothetical protein
VGGDRPIASGPAGRGHHPLGGATVDRPFRYDWYLPTASLITDLATVFTVLERSYRA